MLKKPAETNKPVTGKKSGGAMPREVSANRSWPVSLAWAGALVGVAIVLSAVVNPLFGRYVHWDWMAGLAPTLFVVITLSLRRRWV